MHEYDLHSISLQVRPNRRQNASQISIQIYDPIVYFELVVHVPAPDIQRTHTHRHLVGQGVALGLEGVAPGTLAHR